MQWTRDTYTVDTDPQRLDFDVIQAFLRETYWAKHRTSQQIEAAWKNATVQFGLYDSNHATIGGCRVLSDTTTYAWLGDVFVMPQHRGKGLGKFLIASVLQHPAVIHVEQFHLATQDAHELYKQFGWQPPNQPERLLVRLAQK